MNNEFQNNMIKHIKDKLDAPMIDFTYIKKCVDILKVIDTDRRVEWNTDTFGAYENIVDMNIDSDDIPF